MKPRELGILYKPYLHLAIREDRKTQTRRIIKPGRNQSWLTAEALGKVVRMEPSADGWWTMATSGGHMGSVRSPYRVGDLLYVKEGLRAACNPDKDGGWIYRLDNAPVVVPKENWTASIVWAHHKSSEFCSPLHMPKWAARDWLEVAGVRAERLQSISAADVFAEGVQIPTSKGVPLLCVSGTVRGHIAWEKPKESTADDIVTSWYALLWEEINGPGSWESNPWVWVYEFRRIER